MIEQMIRPKRFCQLGSPNVVVMKSFNFTSPYHGKCIVHQARRTVAGNPTLDVVFFKFGVLPFAFVSFLLGCNFEENKPEKGLGNTQRSIKYARHEKTNAVAPKTNAIYYWKAESETYTTLWLMCSKKTRHTMY